MSTGDLLVLAAGLVLAVGSWAAIFFGIPSVGHSLFRYRLWRLRDDLMDDILAGRMPRHPAVTEMIQHLETAIRFAPHLTAANMVLVSIVSHQRGWKKTWKHSNRDALTKSQAEHLAHYDAEYVRSLVWHLQWTPSGWLAVLFSPLLRLYYRMEKERDGTGQLVHRYTDASLFGKLLGTDGHEREQPISNYV